LLRRQHQHKNLFAEFLDSWKEHALKPPKVIIAHAIYRTRKLTIPAARPIALMAVALDLRRPDANKVYLFWTAGFDRLRDLIDSARAKLPVVEAPVCADMSNKIRRLLKGSSYPKQ